MSRKFMGLVTLTVLFGLAPLTQAGLIGWWTLDEGTGTTVGDASGNGNDGTFQGTPTWVPGVINGALSVDGTSSVTVATTPKLQIAGSVTITCWINPTSFGGERGFCGRDLNYAFKSSGTQLRFTTPGILDHTGANTTLTAGTWQHVAATFEPGQSQGLVFYINGVEAQKLTASAMSQGSGPFHIGTNQWGEAYIGMIDDVRIYDRVLTAGQIREVFNGGTPSFNKAINPSPADGSLAVAMPLLQWGAGDNALLHNVYVGTSPDLTEANLVASRQPFTMLYYVQGLQPGATYYWRVDEIEKDGTTVHTGDVWTFVAQALTAYYPTPADGAVDASPSGALTWLPGQAATKHHVYFGDSSDAVQQGAADVDKGEVTDPTFTPGALESLTTYYWRVDETVVGGEVKTGPVWSFTTCLPVDDFESYTDDEGSRIYETWIDGWTNGTGSTVGNTQAPFAEQTIVHAGLQSMPLDYNNVNSPFYSEAEREFAATQDWTAGGVDTLILWVHGQAGNAPSQLYIAVEDASKKVSVAAYPDTALMGAAQWIQWKIPLSSLGDVNLAKVKKLYIGVGDRTAPAAGGSGRIFLDDIELTKP
jgi:hypothetical protein